MAKPKKPEVTFNVINWPGTTLECVEIVYDKRKKTWLFPDELHAILQVIEPLKKWLDGSDFYLLNTKNKKEI